MIKKYLIFSFLVTILSCTGKSGQQETDVTEVNDIAKEVQIPKALLSEIEADVAKDTRNIAPVYMFTPLQVLFTEYSEGVLKTPRQRFDFPKGGGELDLKDLIKGSGSFYMSFPKESFEKLPELTHLYYVSNSPQKKIQDETFGLGCGKMLDLRNKFKDLQKADYLKLNTGDLRYVFVTAGKYVFVFQDGIKVYMTQLTVTDSRYSNQLCMGSDS